MCLRLVLAVLVLLLLRTAAFAGQWVPAEDQEVVARAELIVVARLDAESVRYVPHASDRLHGRSWEHHASLVVREVLKGSFEEERMQVVIHHGLVVSVDGRFERDGIFVDVTMLRDGAPKGIVELSQFMLRGPGDLIGRDLREDHIWLLRKAPRDFLPVRANRELLGVLDEQDVLPLDRRDYVKAYLANDPEARVRAWLRANPASPSAAGALRFLEHSEVRRILRDPDPARRVERLLPYFRTEHFWGHRDEVGEGIEACGDVAGPYLVAMLTSKARQDVARRSTVLDMLGRLQFAPAYVPIAKLVSDLDAEYARFRRQPWWADDERRERQLRYRGSEFCAGIDALGRLGDARAVPLLRGVLEHWVEDDGWGESIRERCRAALERLDPKPRTEK